MQVSRSRELISTILTTVFTPEYRRLGSWIDRLCRDNREVYGDPTLVAFIYNGKVYKPVAVPEPGNQLVRRGLHPVLTDEMESYLRDSALLAQDKAYIAQSLFKLLDPCEDYQDVRDALPNCLADALPSIHGLTRGRQEAWSIEGDSRAMRQYKKVLPRIEMYAAARLMY